MRTGSGRRQTALNCPGDGGILMPTDGSGGPGAMSHGCQWMIPSPGGNGMMSPGLGGSGMTRAGLTGGIAMTLSDGKTMDGKLLSGFTTRTSETVSLTMFTCTPLNGIQLTSITASSQVNFTT